MPVLKLVLAYDGSRFHGFARQPRHRTVQGEIEASLEPVLGRVPRISIAGRTDAGVHATGQVISFEADVEPGTVQRVLNGRLAPEVVVLDVTRAPAGFDARRSATAREYRYRIRTEPLPDPFTAPFEWHRPGRLAVGAMRRAARDLVGRHDFASLCRVPPDGRSTVRDLRRLSVGTRPTGLEVTAVANAFIRQMVRSLVGTLVAVGEGRLDPASMPEVLAARSRSAAGALAPPDGLLLAAVRYGANPAGGRRSRAPGSTR